MVVECRSGGTITLREKRDCKCEEVHKGEFGGFYPEFMA